MDWFQLLLIFCFLSGSHVSSSPTGKTIISDSLNECFSTGENIFCDFKTSGLSEVYLDRVNSPVKKVFVHNVRKLHLDESVCTEVALKNIQEVVIVGVKDESCLAGFKLLAQDAALKSIPINANSIFLINCNVTQLVTNRRLEVLTMINSDIGLLNISEAFVKHSSLTIEGSRIGKVEKLILDEGANFSVKDSNFVVVPEDSILIHPNAKKSVVASAGYKYTDLVTYRKKQRELLTLKTKKLNLNVNEAGIPNNTEEGSSNTPVIVGVVIAVIALLGVSSMVLYKRFNMKPQKNNSKVEDEANEKDDDNTKEYSRLITGTEGRANENQRKSKDETIQTEKEETTRLGQDGEEISYKDEEENNSKKEEEKTRKEAEEKKHTEREENNTEKKETEGDVINGPSESNPPQNLDVTCNETGPSEPQGQEVIDNHAEDNDQNENVLMPSEEHEDGPPENNEDSNETSGGSVGDATKMEDHDNGKGEDNSQDTAVEETKADDGATQDHAVEEDKILGTGSLHQSNGSNQTDIQVTTRYVSNNIEASDTSETEPKENTGDSAVKSKENKPSTSQGQEVIKNHAEDNGQNESDVQKLVEDKDESKVIKEVSLESGGSVEDLVIKMEGCASSNNEVNSPETSTEEPKANDSATKDLQAEDKTQGTSNLQESNGSNQNALPISTENASNNEQLSVNAVTTIVQENGSKVDKKVSFSYNTEIHENESSGEVGHSSKSNRPTESTTRVIGKPSVTEECVSMHQSKEHSQNYPLRTAESMFSDIRDETRANEMSFEDIHKRLIKARNNNPGKITVSKGKNSVHVTKFGSKEALKIRTNEDLENILKSIESSNEKEKKGKDKNKPKIKKNKKDKPKKENKPKALLTKL